MKTAFLFPGLNGLLRSKDRCRYLPLSHVQKRISEAEVALLNELNIHLDINQMLSEKTEEIYKIDNISLAAVAISAIQTGVADHLKEILPAPSWMVGVSLGDIARSVSAEAYDFKSAVVNHVKFTQKIDGIDKLGGNIGVATTLMKPFTAEDFEWFNERGVDVSVMTSRFLNVGALFHSLEEVRVKAKEKGWRIMPILDYPAHSRYILPYVDASRNDFQKVTTTTPKIPIFSTISNQSLVSPDLIKQEFLETITKTIHFELAIKTLHENHGVNHFINIGPCKSLYTLMRDISLDFKIMDAQDLITI